ncbi:hypothetical protein A1O1_06293 [Capronia coronata CBS 617.96]|uniref:DNA polymerase lambda n=1 Tax=Capronia coronata CBS 617.96 TaxID=1182541 RepID=W9YUH1_9EURO|nr:uncharacterized protein A1O1_06293 [Capronia coronata CBS 617.96]EXJ85924.1 hypothetical protein A1O1_06293 [Capronia coronata CBS 617.96]
MVSTQEKIEKDKFFRDLYLLDSLDDDSPESEVETPIRLAAKAKRQPDQTLDAVQHERAKQITTRGKVGERRPETVPSTVSAVDHTLKKAKVPLPVDAPKKKALPEKRKRAPSTDRELRRRDSEPALTAKSAPSRARRLKTSPSIVVDSAVQTTKRSSEKRKHVTDLSNIKQRKHQLGSKKLPPVPIGEQMLKGLLFYFVPNNDICQARRFRIHKAIQYGAAWANEWCNGITHIIVCDNLDVHEASKEFACKEIPRGPTLVNVNWLIECFSRRAVCDTHWNRFQVSGSEALKETNKEQQQHQSKPLIEHEDSIDKHAVDEETPEGLEANAAECALLDAETESEDELDNAIRDVRSLGSLSIDPSFDDGAKSPGDEPPVDQEPAPFHGDGKARKENAGFMCMEKHDGGKGDNPNEQTIVKLLKMADYYSATGDQWRTRAYRQAVAALRKERRLIRTKQEALTVRGIGDRLAEKIQEIVSIGKLQRLDNAEADPRDKILRLFMGIYHVGFPTASRWIAEGHRTLEDLYQKADLNRNQRIGIEHYEDFQQRIPRAEVAQHAAIVKKALRAADTEAQMIIGGSYRRGSADCGDIDILIFKKDAGLDQIRALMMETVIPELTAQGFLKVALATTHHQDSGSKWHGASALPGSKTWRRLDLLFVPWAELGAALIYFTGNDYFNRSLRLHASRKQMRLNQHGLYADVMRGQGRERITQGRLLEGHDEKRIFEILGVTYRPPEHRNP